MSLNHTLENLRVHYKQSAFDVSDCDHNPILQFDRWFSEAVSGQCDEPNAFVLSTIADGKPRGRVVLLKGLHQGKFVFYTNYSSAKGQELEKNAFVAMNFLWLPLERQIRIEGKVNKVTEAMSDDYFNKRPRGNQLGAVASPQSQKVASRDALENLFHKTEVLLKGNEKIERPKHWGGYEIEPHYFEFWQGRESRMHDRICYEKASSGWELSRLAP